MSFEEAIQNKPEHLAEIARLVREFVLQCHPDIKESIYEGKVMQDAGYYIGIGTNHVAIISPEDAHCKIYITHFDKVDARGLLFEGKGTRSRHIRLFQSTDLTDGLADVLRDVAQLAAQAQ